MNPINTLAKNGEKIIIEGYVNSCSLVSYEKGPSFAPKQYRLNLHNTKVTNGQETNLGKYILNCEINRNANMDKNNILEWNSQTCAVRKIPISNLNSKQFEKISIKDVDQIPSTPMTQDLDHEQKIKVLCEFKEYKHDGKLYPNTTILKIFTNIES